MGLLFALLLLPVVSAHPQCLNFFPPFVPQQALSYCHSHSSLGCCSAADDQQVADDVTQWLVGITLSDDAAKTCSSHVKELVCSQCSQWSQHLYDRMELNVSRSSILHRFPAMCPLFCQQLFTNCSLYLHQLLQHDFPQNITDFCDNIQRASDESYCYPFTYDASRQSISADVNESCVCLKPVVSDLRNPLAAVYPGDGTNRLFIVEQIGVIRIIKDQQLLMQPFLDITRNVVSLFYRADERGLLGMAFHPQYKTNGRFFVYYSIYFASERGFFGRHISRVSEFCVSKNDTNVADKMSERVVMQIEQPRFNHNGGQLLFGDDGFLYIFLGDGGAAGDPFGSIGNGQNRSTLLGSVLRIDVDEYNSTHGYSVPSCNPFVGILNVRPEIYSYGVRNPWRCSFDRGDSTNGSGRGRLFCGDVGQNKFEEIDIIEKGRNYGWRGKEGFECYQADQCHNMEKEELPIFAYNHSVGKSVTGGYVYRGCQFPLLHEKYIFGDYESGRLFALSENRMSGKWENEELCVGDESICHGEGVLGRESVVRGILSFGEDEDGEMYMLAVHQAFPTLPLGTVYQIIDPYRRASPTECAKYYNHPVGVHPLPPNAKCGVQPTTDAPTMSSPEAVQPTETHNVSDSKCQECRRKKTYFLQYCHFNYQYTIHITINRSKQQKDGSSTITGYINGVFSGHPTTQPKQELQLLETADRISCQCRRLIPTRHYLIMGHYNTNNQPIINTDSLVSTWKPVWIQKLKKAANRRCEHAIT